MLVPRVVGVLALVGVFIPVRGGVQSQGPIALQAEMQPGMATPYDGPEVVGVTDGSEPNDAAAVDVHATAPAPFVPRVRHRSDNDTKAQAEIDQATKSLKAKPDNIFPEDDRGLVSRADDEDTVYEVVSDGTQEGLIRDLLLRPPLSLPPPHVRCTPLSTTPPTTPTSRKTTRPSRVDRKARTCCPKHRAMCAPCHILPGSAPRRTPRGSPGGRASTRFATCACPAGRGGAGRSWILDLA